MTLLNYENKILVFREISSGDFENCKILPSSSSDAFVYGMAIEIITLSFLMPWKLHEWSLTLYQRSTLIPEKRIHFILLSLDSWFLAYVFVTLGINRLCRLTSSFLGTSFSSCHIIVISNLKNNNEMLTRGTIQFNFGKGYQDVIYQT